MGDDLDEAGDKAEKAKEQAENCQEATKLLNEAAKLLQMSGKHLLDDNLIKIKEEIDELINDANTSQSSDDSDSENSGSIDNLKDAISSIKLSHVSKLSKYSKGENFSRYCDRFLEYIRITRMKDRNLYLYFLQKMDDETYTILKTAKLTTEQKANGKLFVPIYKELIYGSEKTSLRNEVIDCKQNFGESVRDYAYRILEKANIAFEDSKVREDNCLMTLLRGVRDTHIKRKLNEVSLQSFDEAVKYAEKLERIERMLNPEQNITPILREISDFKFRSKREDSRSRDRYRSSSRGRDSSSESWRSNSSRGSDRQSRSRGQNWSNNSRNRENFGSRNRSRENGRRSNFSQRSRSQNRAIQRYSDKTCWNCNKRGHIQRNCWSRGNGPRQQIPHHPHSSQTFASFQPQHSPVNYQHPVNVNSHNPTLN